MNSNKKEKIKTAFYTITGPHLGKAKQDGSNYENWKVTFHSDYRRLHPSVPRQKTRATKAAAIESAKSIVDDLAKLGNAAAEFNKDELLQIATQASYKGLDPVEVLKEALDLGIGRNSAAIQKPISDFWSDFRSQKSSAEWNTPRVASQWDSFFSRHAEFFSTRIGEFIEPRNGRKAVEKMLKQVSEDCEGDPATNTLKNYKAKAKCFLSWLCLREEVPQLTEDKIRRIFASATVPKSRAKHEFNPIITPDQALLLIRELAKDRLATYAVLQIFMGARTELLHGSSAGKGWKRNFIHLDSNKIQIPAAHTKTLKKKSRYQTVNIDSIPALRPWLEFAIPNDKFPSQSSPIARITQPAVSQLFWAKILKPFSKAWFLEGEHDHTWGTHYRNALRNSFFSYGIYGLEDQRVLSQAAENKFNHDFYANHNVCLDEAERYFALRPSDLEKLDDSKIRPLDQ